MGVRGLTTFINNKQDVYMKNYYLHHTKLVIDGLSLCSQLYRSLNCFSAFGGDYDKYASFVKTFFKNLRKSNITAYVIFDGSYEKKKLKTVYNRLKARLKSASRLDPVTQGSLQIFPFLLRDVFKEVLMEMNIAFTVCEFEADDEIASLARHLNCPVLSYDSDFFIYNVLYIPFNTLEMKSKPIYLNDKKVYAMGCKIFRVQHFMEHFGGLQQELLPLLATLLGNDYVEKKVFRKFFSQLKLTQSRKNKNDQQRCIHALFNWLQNETLDSAISKILGRLKKNQKDRVYAIIKKGIEGYNSKECRSVKYFDIPEVKEQESEINVVNIKEIESLLNTNASDEDKDSSSDNESSDNDYDDNSSNNEDEDVEIADKEIADEENTINNESNVLPDWFITKVRHNSLPFHYLNLFTHHVQFCNPQPEDFTDVDSFLCALPILRYAFDLLTDFSHENLFYISRERSHYKKMFVGKEYSVPRCVEKSFNNLTDEELKTCFYHFFKQKMEKLDWNLISLLPNGFQLFMLAILWWVANCNVPMTHVHSIIITYITLNVIDERTGTVRGHFLFNSNYKKKIQELRNRKEPDITVDEELYLNKNLVQYEDCVIAASVLLKHFEIDDTIRRRPKSYDVKRMHSFSQFQCILQQINCLNALCGRPLENTIYYKCYNGTFVYNIALTLENQTDPGSYFKQYIKGATTVLMLYRSICSVFDNLISQMNLTTVKWSKRKRSRGKKGNDISFITEAFASEVVI